MGLAVARFAQFDDAIRSVAAEQEVLRAGAALSRC